MSCANCFLQLMRVGLVAQRAATWLLAARAILSSRVFDSPLAAEPPMRRLHANAHPAMLYALRCSSGHRSQSVRQAIGGVRFWRSCSWRLPTSSVLPPGMRFTPISRSRLLASAARKWGCSIPCARFRASSPSRPYCFF